MLATITSANWRVRFAGAVTRSALIAIAVAVAVSGVANASFNDSFMSIPGTTGKWRGTHHKSWIRIEDSYWTIKSTRMNAGGIDGDRLTFAGPAGPRPGTASTLVIAMNKHNPDLPQLLDMCAKKTLIPELSYVESSDFVRPLLEVGPRPPELPEYWEYTLKGSVISDCPVVADADDQALVVSFNDIVWRNYDASRPEPTKVVIKPSNVPDVKPAKPSDNTKAFVITWIAPANDVSEDQCPVMNTAPTDADYYALMPKEVADKERVENAKHGGVSFGGLNIMPQMDWRGPDKLNAPKLPGIVRDPGFAEPKSKIAYGVNLDGDDGHGRAPAGVCKHQNYVSPDGRLKGVDNQLFTVMGCVAGHRGKKGYLNQTSNTHRADGLITTLIEVSGIDNEMKGGGVDVAVIYSHDHVGRDATGKHFIPYFSYRATDDPQLAYYAVRLHGRIVDGVITTDPVKTFSMNMGLDPLLIMQQGQMRLEILPDGNLKGVLGGYVDWRRVMEGSSNSYGEQFFGYQAPGMYHALKRAADGMKDPTTGECTGISAAYEIEGVPAFITASRPSVAKSADNATAAASHASTF